MSRNSKDNPYYAKANHVMLRKIDMTKLEIFPTVGDGGGSDNPFGQWLWENDDPIVWEDDTPISVETDSGNGGGGGGEDTFGRWTWEDGSYIVWEDDTPVSVET